METQSPEDSGISLSPSYRQLSNELRFESRRLLTFRNWPVDAPIEPGRVAKAGFFSTGSGCEVQCFACGGKVSSWDYGDQAVLRHRQMNPSCPFVLNRSSNVPLQSETEASLMPATSPRQSLSSPGQPIPSRSHSEESQSEGYGSSSGSTSWGPTTDGSVFSTHGNGPLSSSALPAAQPTSVPSPSTSRQGARSYLTHQEWNLLRREEARLRSFDQRFTATFLSPQSLAQAGFFYLGTADQVQCAFCRGVVRDWEANDDPRREHQRLFPSCPFMLGLPVGNVRLGEETTFHSPAERTASLPIASSASPDAIATNGFGVTPRFTPQMRPNASPDTETNASQLNALIGDNLEELGIQKHSGPRYTAYTTVESRLKSFSQWPSRLKQTPKAMAQAGFFYLGTNDHVNCFHCGCGLRNWEPEDDPWLEHARWFPQCRFLLLMKGEQYVLDAAQSMAARTRKPPPPSTATNSPRPPPREVPESELRALLESPIAQTVLAMGVDLSRVKQAYLHRMRSTGQAFNTVDSLLEAAIEVQQQSEQRQALENHEYEVVEWPEMPLTATAPSQPMRDDDEANQMDERNSPVVETPVVPMEQEATSPPAAPPTSSSGSDRTQLLEEEIRRLKEARLCKVCLDEEVSIAYIPCGHIVTCVQCAAALDCCPLCRKNIKGTVRIFFS